MATLDKNSLGGLIELKLTMPQSGQAMGAMRDTCGSMVGTERDGKSNLCGPHFDSVSPAWIRFVARNVDAMVFFAFKIVSVT